MNRWCEIRVSSANGLICCPSRGPFSDSPHCDLCMLNGYVQSLCLLSPGPLHAFLTLVFHGCKYVYRISKRYDLLVFKPASVSTKQPSGNVCRHCGTSSVFPCGSLTCNVLPFRQKKRGFKPVCNVSCCRSCVEQYCEFSIPFAHTSSCNPARCHGD